MMPSDHPLESAKSLKRKMRHWSGALPAMSKTAAAQHRFFVFCVAPSLAVLALITLLPSLYLLRSEEHTS